MNCCMSVMLVLSLVVTQGGVAFLLNFQFLSLGGQCSTSIGGCQCLDSWRYNREEFIGCANPDGLAKDPWCIVDSNTCDPRGTLEDGSSFDYCTAGCLQTPVSNQEDTYLGCKCADIWSYQGQTFSGCSNPDNDVLGEWCVVEQDSCSSGLGDQLLGIFIEAGARYDYCSLQSEGISMETGVDRCSSVFWMLLGDYGLDFLQQSSFQLPGQAQSTARAFVICQPLSKALSKREDLSLFAKILMETGLDEVIKMSQDLTIFAPTDIAIEQFAADNNIAVQDLFLFQTNKVMLGQVSSLHVVTQSLKMEQLFESNGTSLPTLVPSVSLQINVEGDLVQINIVDEVGKSANVIRNSYTTKVCGGQLFTVDALLAA